MTNTRIKSIGATKLTAQTTISKYMKVGRPRNFEDPIELLKLWDEYKAHIDNNYDKDQVVTVRGDIVERQVKKPYLKQGFEAFVYRRHKMSIKDYLSDKYKEFSDVVTCIRQEWEEDQISGTLTGKYKAPNLVARLNGLVEKSAVTVTEQQLFPDVKPDKE